MSCLFESGIAGVSEHRKTLLNMRKGLVKSGKRAVIDSTSFTTNALLQEQLFSVELRS